MSGRDKAPRLRQGASVLLSRLAYLNPAVDPLPEPEAALQRVLLRCPERGARVLAQRVRMTGVEVQNVNDLE